MARQDPKRVRLLLETKRVVFNQLPFRFDEYDETFVINDLCIKDEFQHPINAKSISYSIVEMYTSTKQEIMGVLSKNGLRGTKIVTIMADSWTCKMQHAKYLGVWIYSINNEWKMESILLGTRRFNPFVGDRDTGIRRPFRRWLNQMLSDFGLSSANLFGGYERCRARCQMDATVWARAPVGMVCRSHEQCLHQMGVWYGE
ncbi:hypothetical protein PINS_up007203 [Pythium insidiosum]|nr:hypothetical protein PINS_up007203 [Pythium insidiosum]